MGISKMTTEQTATNNAYLDSSDILKKPDISILNGYYTDGDSVDQDVFAEMRSSVLLVAGEHYARKDSTFYRRIRDSKDLTKEQKLRLTKNHTRKICQIYANNITSANPGVGFIPKDENSTHDQKAAELHHSVWRDAYERYNIDDKIDDWVDSFVQIGEVHVKVFYDPNAGRVAGYEPLIDPATGQPVLNEFGEMVPDESRPVTEGEFIFEEVYGFNLLRPPECKDIRKAEWLCIRKMVDRGDLLRKFGKEKAKLITSDQDETYVIFDITKGGYRQSKKQTMLREFYFRPCLAYPDGYFYITTKEGILAEGKLPGGRFPIVSALFDKLQTTPRGRSPVKTMRPYQAEINRAASKMAEHQITLGDDKLIIQNGTKVSAGVSLPGVRSINVTGATPTILQGRDGSQYLNTISSNITEMYQVMMVQEDMENQEMKLDPYVLLFRSGRQKKKFQRYIKRFEKFLIEVVKLYLSLAKIHLPDDAVIMAIGKNEAINIAEYREMSDISYEIKVEAQAEDVETKLGKQLVLNHALQYIGPQLKPDDIGKIMRQMPYVNFDESFDDLTIDFDSVQNDILALDRGERPPVNQYDNHVYNIKRLVLRTRKSDFKYLPPEVQQNYFEKIKLHQEFEVRNQEAIQRAQQGFIPTGGALISVDFYVNVPNSTGGVKQTKAKIPYESINWLVKQLEAQGASQENLERMNQGAMAQMSEMFLNRSMNAPAYNQADLPNGMGRYVQ